MVMMQRAPVSCFGCLIRSQDGSRVLYCGRFGCSLRRAAMSRAGRPLRTDVDKPGPRCRAVRNPLSFSLFCIVHECARYPMIFAQAAACGNTRVGPIISPAIQISVYSLRVPRASRLSPYLFLLYHRDLNFFYVDNDSKFWRRLGCVVVSFDFKFATFFAGTRHLRTPKVMGSLLTLPRS
jgi:hypothetical protein